jgi:putative addiction module killer protein
MRYKIKYVGTFGEWLAGLKDAKARRGILARIGRAENGNLGDYKVFDGIIEMRIFYGPGYRLYGAIRDGYILLLLCGGDKSSQRRDIETAKKILDEVENGN